jgi:hypothetical protein
MNVDIDEQAKVVGALSGWFESQGISPKEAPLILAHMLGSMIAFHSRSPEHLENGILRFKDLIEVFAKLYEARPSIRRM